jgi:hypothetical protein
MLTGSDRETGKAVRKSSGCCRSAAATAEAAAVTAQGLDWPDTGIPSVTKGAL